MYIIETIVDLVRYLVYWLSTLIYQLIIHLYDIFMRLCNSRILDAEILKVITDRVGVILGLVMLFMVVFSMIQMVLEPEKLTDKEKGIGNIVKKILIVIVLLGTSKIIFSGLYGLQKNIIESNIITKFILPYEINEENQKNFGAILSGKLFTSFYYYDEALGNSNLTDEVFDCKEAAIILENEILIDNKFSSGYKCINSKVGIGDEEEYIMHLDLLLLPIVGVVAVYFIFSYCLSVGTRTIQLAFLEIISPMAIISYLSPKKDTMFNKWWKLYFSTYIDVFLRIAIISLVVFLIGVIYDSNLSETFWGSVGDRQGPDILIQVFIVFALLMFAKKAPELLKDLFPSSGGSKLGLGLTSPKKIFDNMLGGNYVKGAAKVATVGSAIGLTNAITSGVSRYKINKKNGRNNWQAALGAAGGVFSGLGRGLVAGAQKGNPYSTFTKGIKAQRDLNDKYDELITSGGSTMGKIGAGISAHWGETPGQEYTRYIRNNEDVTKEYSAINDAAEGFKYVKIAKTMWENAKARGESNEKIKEAYDNYKLVKKAHITDALKGEKFDDPEDQSIAAGITVHKTELENLVKVKQVNLEYVEELPDGTKVKRKITKFEDYDSINNASISASTNIAEIKQKEDYSKAIANDKAAGINSNGSGKK